jgi:hypothetical protein
MTAQFKNRELGAGFLALLIGIVCLAWAQVYPPRESALPALVGWTTIALALIDIAARFDNRWSRILRQIAGLEWGNAGGEKAAPPAWPRIAVAMLWLVGYAAAIYFFGLLVTTPIYILLYMRIHGGKPVGVSALSTAVITIAIWVTFEFLFRYPLYPGLLFGGR